MVKVLITMRPGQWRTGTCKWRVRKERQESREVVQDRSLKLFSLCKILSSPR